MIVMWPPVDKDSADYENQRLQIIRKALQCSQEIQKSMNNMIILPGVCLSVKVRSVKNLTATCVHQIVFLPQLLS